MIQNIDTYPQLAETKIDTWWTTYKSMQLKTYLENEYESIQRCINSTFHNAIRQAQPNTKSQIKTVIDDIIQQEIDNTTTQSMTNHITNHILNQLNNKDHHTKANPKNPHHATTTHPPTKPTPFPHLSNTLEEHIKTFDENQLQQAQQTRSDMAKNNLRHFHNEVLNIRLNGNTNATPN